MSHFGGTKILHNLVTISPKLARRKGRESLNEHTSFLYAFLKGSLIEHLLCASPCEWQGPRVRPKGTLLSQD